jgi:hypothetical protein
MQRALDPLMDLGQGKPVRNQFFNRQSAAKYQIGGLPLKIHGRAVRSAQNPLSHTHIGARYFNPLLV